jgi:hypothetical protein
VKSISTVEASLPSTLHVVKQKKNEEGFAGSVIDDEAESNL